MSKNVKTLRDDLLNVYDELRAEKISDSHAKAAAQVSGKILSSARLEWDYDKHQKINKKIDFLEVK